MQDVEETMLNDTEPGPPDTEDAPERSALFELSTQVSPPLKFTIDGEWYELRTVSHLTKAEEGKLRKMVLEERKLNAKFEKVSYDDERRMSRLSDESRNARLRLIQMMTDVPRHVLESLPPTEQVKLTNTIGKDVEDILDAEDDDEE